MRVIVVGLGNQGTKRARVARVDLVATVDPVAPGAGFRRIRDVPLDSFDSALVCTPDSAKEEALDYLLSNGKHVLVEKPLLLGDPVAFERLARLARKARVACYTAYNHRFEPCVAKLKAVVESGQLGRVYLARFFYGNGTARDVRDSAWRDRGMGVLSDLGSHLLDLRAHLFGGIGPDPCLSARESFENKACDYVAFEQPSLEDAPLARFEATLLSWKNAFSIDLLAEKGSAHAVGLCKWGPSSCVVRERVLPSGCPKEESFAFEGPDPTWEAEYAAFKRLCAAPRDFLEHDAAIGETLVRLHSMPKEPK